jgi:succinate dehydrogenase / fumarate reductase flavoprotein subunit
METIELGHCLDVSEVILASALRREESRGGHFRMDFPERDDKNFLKHSLTFRTEKGVEVKYIPVTVTRFQPQARVY